MFAYYLGRLALIENDVPEASRKLERATALVGRHGNFCARVYMSNGPCLISPGSNGLILTEVAEMDTVRVR